MGDSSERHRHVDSLDFLRQIDRETFKDKERLEEHPRFHVHFTPTSASWLKLVERFFRSVSTDRLEHGVFRSVPELIAAMESSTRLTRAG